MRQIIAEGPQMADQKQEISPTLKVEFSNDNGGDLVFKSNQEILNWLIAEKSFWSWILTVPQALGNPYSQPINGLISALGKINNYLAQVGTDPNRIKPSDASTLIIALRDTNSFHSGSLKARVIDNIHKTYGLGAGATVMCHLRGAPINLNSPDAFWGVMQYHLQIRGMNSESNQVLVDAFDKSRKDQELKFDNLKGRAEGLLSDLDNAKVDAGKVQKRFIQRYEAAKRWGNAKWTEFAAARQTEINKGVDELKQVEKTYKEHMALSAPVTYWKEKAAEHHKNCHDRGWWLFWYAVSAPTIFVVIGAVCWFCVKNSTEDKYPLLIGGLFISTILLWVGRILVRLYLSEVHLRIDAKQRVTMVMTYLALVNDNKIAATERELVLTPLFAPTSDGIVKDDAAPLMSLSSLLSSKAAS